MFFYVGILWLYIIIYSLPFLSTPSRRDFTIRRTHLELRIFLAWNFRTPLFFFFTIMRTALRDRTPPSNFITPLGEKKNHKPNPEISIEKPKLIIDTAKHFSSVRPIFRKGFRPLEVWNIITSRHIIDRVCDWRGPLHSAGLLCTVLYSTYYIPSDGFWNLILSRSQYFSYLLYYCPSSVGYNKILYYILRICYV